MSRFFSISTLAFTACLAWGQPARVQPLISCTEVFDHSYSLDKLLDQFRDDDIRWNMRNAAPVFWSHPELTIEYIYQALKHEDWQVRQVICHEIWNRMRDKQVFHLNPPSDDGSWNGGFYESIPGDPRFTITRELILVTIEGLRDDSTPYDFVRRRGLTLSNARLGTQMLIPVAHEWSAELIAAMESDDRQQRFLAAYILARAGVAPSVDRAAEILLPHLRDNDIRGDANFSVFALGGYGIELVAILEQTLPSADQQQRDLIMLLLLNIRDPAATENEQAKRSRFNTITKNHHDPTQSPSSDVWNVLDQF